MPISPSPLGQAGAVAFALDAVTHDLGRRRSLRTNSFAKFSTHPNSSDPVEFTFICQYSVSRYTLYMSLRPLSMHERIAHHVESMRDRTQRRANEVQILWERPEPRSRPAPSPLSRELIVAAAISVADEKGLAAVSLRKVGALLDAGPMRLYGYLSTKEELLELMVDAVYGEMSVEPVGGHWREVLLSIARRTRQAAQKHTWFVHLVGGRPHLGPNALAFYEESLRALSATPGFEDIDIATQALKTVNAYVIGAIWSESSELSAERESGMNEEQWQSASWPYIQRVIATGRFPMLEKTVRDATHPPIDVVFERGLECVLDGVAAQLQR